MHQLKHFGICTDKHSHNLDLITARCRWCNKTTTQGIDEEGKTICSKCGRGTGPIKQIDTYKRY